NNTASTARRSSSRSSTGFSSLILQFRVHGRTVFRVKCHPDLPELLRLLQLDLPFTVKLQEGQEPHHDVDAFLAVRHQVTEPSRPQLTQTPLHVSNRVGYRRANGSDVGEIHHRRWAKRRRRGLRQALGGHPLHEVRVEMRELLG